MKHPAYPPAVRWVSAALGALLLAAVVATSARILSGRVSTGGWATLGNACAAGTGDDSPSGVALGGISGHPFSLEYPRDWQVLQSDDGDCTAMLQGAAIPRAFLSVNGYGSIGPFSFQAKPTDAAYADGAYSVRQQVVPLAGGREATVSEITRGNHVEGILTLEYQAGFLDTPHYRAVSLAIARSFRATD